MHYGFSAWEGWVFESREDAKKALRIHPGAAPREAGALHSKIAYPWIWGAPCGPDAPHALRERRNRYENEDISRDFLTPDHNMNRPEIGPMIGDHFTARGRSNSSGVHFNKVGADSNRLEVHRNQGPGSPQPISSALELITSALQQGWSGLQPT